MARGANFGFCVFCITHHIWCFKMISSKNAKMNTINRTINSKPPSTFPHVFLDLRVCLNIHLSECRLAPNGWAIVYFLQCKIIYSSRHCRVGCERLAEIFITPPAAQAAIVDALLCTWIFHDKTKRSHQQHCRAVCRNIHHTTSSTGCDS